MDTSRVRAVKECMDEAYAHYERGLARLMAESLGVLNASLTRQGLTNFTSAPTFLPPTIGGERVRST